jgi:hypothetical protein
MATINTTDPKPGFVYDLDTDTWFPLLGLATQSLDGLTDVIITTPSTNQVLAYNGTNWVNSSEAGDVSAVTSGTGITVTNGTGPIPSIAIDTTVTADLTTAQTLTNKTLTTPVISSISNTGTVTLPTATDTLVGRATTDTLTNKTVNLTSNTLSGTIAQFNTALSDADFATLAGTETLTNKTLTAPVISYSVNAVTSSTYTTVATDAAAIVTMNNGSANTFSIPTNASVPYAVGSSITIIQIGAGQTTINAVTSGTTTIASVGATPAAPALRAQYSSATCIKVATDTWYVVGDVA